MARDGGLLRRAVVAVVASLLVTAAAFAVALTAAAAAGSANREMSQRLVPAAAAAVALQTAYNAQTSALRNYVTSGGVTLFQDYLKTSGPIAAAQDQADPLIAGYQRLPVTLQAAESAHLVWLAKVAGPQLAAMARGDIARAQALQADIPVIRPYSLAVRNAMSALQGQITARQARVATRIGSAQQYELGALVTMGLLVAVITAGGLWTVRRWLLVPFTALRRATEAVAVGKHETRIPAAGPAELAALGRTAELMRTALVDALAAAGQAEEQFRRLFQSSPDPMYALTGDGTIVMANAQVGQLFGYSADELTGQPAHVLIPAAKDRVEKFLASLGAEPVSGRSATGRTRDGREFPVEVTVAALPPGSEMVALVSLRDVSERLAAQAEAEELRAEAERERMSARLAQAERLESLGQLVGGVAHDFNNLLNVITGYTGMVADQLDHLPVPRPQIEPVQADVDQVRGAAQRAVSLTRQLLTFARRDVVHPEILDTSSVVGEIADLLGRTVGEHIDLVTTLVPDVCLVNADRGQLEQVIVNLAINARDAMPGGGALTVDTAVVDADEGYTAAHPGLAPGSYVRLRVSDTGTGMPPEVRAKVFEPFFTTKTKGSGTGLGLATVYGIITRAGGRVQVYSVVGIGTTISVLLPLAAGTPREARREKTAETAPGRGETVLLVEDEASLWQLGARLLTRGGYQVLTATTPADALVLAHDDGQRIDLLLTDVVMPGMLGTELADQLTGLRPGLPVLFMSGYAQPVLDAHGAFSDDIDLLEKPFPATALLARVRQAIDQAIDAAVQHEAAGPDGADSAPAGGPHAQSSRGGRAKTKGGRVRPG
jgi:PAS domain S-box-containing protein